jgi:glycosyltransferase involved in cell wall biosynthesis
VPSLRVISNGRCATGLAAEEKQPFVFAAGRMWDEAKNLSVLERAAPRCSWPIYVAGQRRDGNAAASAVRSLGRLPAADMARWFGRASIYAAPARYEPFGLSILEAAFAGCALVLGDIPSLREVWGDAALFVPPGDEGALATTLDELAVDEAGRTRLAARARRRAQALTAERMGQAYARLYDELIDGRVGKGVRSCVS